MMSEVFISLFSGILLRDLKSKSTVEMEEIPSSVISSHKLIFSNDTGINLKRGSPFPRRENIILMIKVITSVKAGRHPSLMLEERKGCGGREARGLTSCQSLSFPPASTPDPRSKAQSQATTFPSTSSAITRLTYRVLSHLESGNTRAANSYWVHF